MPFQLKNVENEIFEDSIVELTSQLLPLNLFFFQLKEISIHIIHLRCIYGMLQK